MEVHSFKVVVLVGFFNDYVDTKNPDQGDKGTWGHKRVDGKRGNEPYNLVWYIKKIYNQNLL